MTQVDINCDLGESFGNYTIGNEILIMPYISSANIACGFHAGDPLNIERSIKLALKNNVKIGAHPGYPDLQGFGRRSMKMSKDEIRSMIVYQVAALKGICESLGGILHHVKPHGALYNDAVQDDDIAQAIAKAVHQVSPELKVLGLSGSRMLQIAEEWQLSTLSEVFADRAYTADGQLVPRSWKGAVIHNIELCKQRALLMIQENKVLANNGEFISIKADTICIHSDNPSAVDMCKAIYYYLEENNIRISKL